MKLVSLIVMALSISGCVRSITSDSFDVFFARGVVSPNSLKYIGTKGNVHYFKRYTMFGGHKMKFESNELIVKSPFKYSNWKRNSEISLHTVDIIYKGFESNISLDWKSTLFVSMNFQKAESILKKYGAKKIQIKKDQFKKFVNSSFFEFSSNKVIQITTVDSNYEINRRRVSSIKIGFIDPKSKLKSEIINSFVPVILFKCSN